MTSDEAVAQSRLFLFSQTGFWYPQLYADVAIVLQQLKEYRDRETPSTQLSSLPLELVPIRFPGTS